MAKIYLTRPIPSPGPELLLKSRHEMKCNMEDRSLRRDELLAAVRECAGVLTQLHDKVDAEFFDAAGPGLKVVSNFAVGHNNIDVAEASRRGVAVCNTPGVLTEATADVAWLLLMGVARRAHEGEKLVRAGRFHGWGPNMLVGSDLVGKTLAVVGAGRIGFAVGRRAKAWNMRLIYVARKPHEDFEKELGATRMELDAALREADFVSIHVPLTDETRHMFDARRLGLMKKTAYLVNTARGPVVDEKSLILALKSGVIAGAGLDVYEDEPRLADGLAECPNTFLLPHLGSATKGTRAAMAETSARNLLLVLEGKPPLHRVV